MIYGLAFYAIVILWMWWEIKHPMQEKTEVSEESGFEVDEHGNLIEITTVKFHTV